MKKFRIGNDLTCYWNLFRNGKAEDFAGKDIDLYLINPSMGRLKMPFTIDDNKIVFTFAGVDQEEAGAYSCVLIETHADGTYETVDAVTAFILAERLCNNTVDNTEPVSAEFASEILVGPQGESAYKAWLKCGYEGTEEDFIDWLRAPAVSAGEIALDAAKKAYQAEKEVLATNELMKLAEAERVTAETARVEAENSRVANENARKEAEAGRVTAETARVEAENSRVTDETARKEAEAGRVTAETARVEAENSRVADENARKEAEAGRVAAESARVEAENSRVSDETARKEAEAGRVTAETERVEAENSRVSDETTRKEAEAGRVTAETARVEAENSRVTEENARKEAEAGRVTAETARVEAENLRVSDETARKEAEAGRVTAETARVEAENSRVTEENARKEAEAARVTAETARVEAENSRVANENARKEAEAGRVTAETARVEAENSRVTEENARKEAEAGRVTAETARVEAENSRVTDENARKEAEAARVTAETARVEAENSRVANENARKEAEAARVEAEVAREELAAAMEIMAKEAKSIAESANTTAADAESNSVTAKNTAAQAAAAATKALTEVQGKQDKLTAGTGIAIENNEIKVTLDTTIYKIVESLPATPLPGNANKIHLVLSTAGEEGNLYSEYLYTNGQWEQLGTYIAKIDLTPYLTTIDAAATYLTKTAAAATYQPKGSYLTSITKAQVESVLTGNITTHTHNQYLTAHQSLAAYLTKTDAAATYQPKGSYLTAITKAQVEAVLTGNITTHTHSQYLTAHQSLAAYITKTDAAATYQPKGNYLTAITKAQVEAVLTGNITTHTHSQYLTAHQTLDHINNLGNFTAVSGATKVPSGLRLCSVYNNGYPIAYGNLLRIGGVGGGELLCQWTPTTTAGRLYYRSKRDQAETEWSSWATVAYTSDMSISAGVITINGVSITPLTQHQSLTHLLRIDGTNGTAAGLTALINKLSEGDSNMTDATMLVTSHATTPGSNNYYRRPASFLWGYVKGKADAVYLLKSSYTASDVLSKIKTVDGSGSGLDTDLLDGVHGAGYCRAYSGNYQFGSSNATITTAEFVEKLKTLGAFNQPYWMAKGSWYYAGNNIISDTGIGNIQLAGAVVEVMGTSSAYTIRITTAPATTNGIANAVYIYRNHGNDYNPGWKRLANTDDAVAYAVELYTPRTLTIGSTGKTFNGSSNVSWSLAEIGAAAAGHTHSQYLTAITKTQVESVLTGNITTHTHSQYLTAHQSLAAYLTKTDAAATYQPKGNYLTAITKAQIEAVLTGNITTHTHSQYLTSHQSLSNYYTKGESDLRYIDDIDITGNNITFTRGNMINTLPLPKASYTTFGGVKLGTLSLEISSDETLNLKSEVVTAGSYAKVTVDTFGRVVAGMALAAADIPSLSWSKITSGKPTTLAGYGITDGINALRISGTGDAFTDISISGHTLQVHKGKTFIYRDAQRVTSNFTLDGTHRVLIIDASTLVGITLPSTTAGTIPDGREYLLCCRGRAASSFPIGLGSNTTNINAPSENKFDQQALSLAGYGIYYIVYCNLKWWVYKIA